MSILGKVPLERAAQDILDSELQHVQPLTNPVMEQAAILIITKSSDEQLERLHQGINNELTQRMWKELADIKIIRGTL